MRTYNVVGVMSGTSMDGLDIAHCSLTLSDEGKWGYIINAAKTIDYDEVWRLRLSKLRNQSALVTFKTDRYFGEYIGREVKAFLRENNLEADLISSHGHTIFHQPENNLSFQVGSGSAISGVTGIPAVTNFRAMDVVKNGEGAPISGIADRLLFKEFDMCLNLGGFANISGLHDGEPVAYDVCPCNILLNRVAREFGQEYDKDGEIAEQGSIDYDLLSDLNSIEYYAAPYPKSLGREWINKNFWYRVRNSDAENKDRMKTLVDHIGVQIGNNIEGLAEKDPTTLRVLTTGGGAFNKALIGHIQSHTDAQIIVPEDLVVHYKEALAFALMGILRVLNQSTIIAAYTGADEDSVAGDLSGDFSSLLT
jgi:anhydro-N-acetylmuramic acid kinase